MWRGVNKQSDFFIAMLGLYGLALGLAVGGRPPPIVGAIRWDAYFSQPGEPAFEVRKAVRVPAFPFSAETPIHPHPRCTQDPNFGIVTRTTTNDMSPEKWHYRVPFFGEEINSTAIVANGNSPEVMGQELQYAQDHGIKFW